MYALVSTRSDGDFNIERVPAATLQVRRRALVDAPWTMTVERHGVAVREVGSPGNGDGDEADVLSTSCASAVLGVWAGDCAPVILVADDGRIVAAHAGWRGVVGGVLDVAVEALGAGRAGAVSGFLGPTIGPCCYEFGGDDLARVARAVGASADRVTARDRLGRPSLDMRVAVEVGLARHGIEIDTDAPCTGCDLRYFSHRVRGERERHVVAVWRSP